MDYITLKNQNDELKIPKLCYGYDKPNDKSKELRQELLERFLTCSNFIDTARIYGNLSQNGSGGSEEALSCDLLALGVQIKDVIISTKGGHPKNALRDDDRLDCDSLQSDLNESLKFLQRDFVDIYFLHRDSGHDLTSLMRTLNQFVVTGKVRFLGASNWSVERILQANKIAKSEGLAEFAISQIGFSLAQTSSEKWEDPTLVAMNGEIYKEYQDSKIPVMAFSPQGHGYFPKLQVGTLSEKAAKRYDSSLNRKRAERVFELAKKFNVSISSIPLKFLQMCDVPTSAVISSSNLNQLNEAFDTEKFTLTEQELRFLSCLY